MIVPSDEYINSLKPDIMVAVKMEGSKTPVIGKVIAVNHQENTFKLNYWTGSYLTSWKPHMIHKKGKKPEPWSDTLPFTCLLLVDFQFENKMLTPH